MNIIQNAISQGFTAANVIQYLSRHFPNQRKKIEKAIQQGFSAEQIVSYLGGGRKEISNPVTEHERTRQGDKDKQRNLEKNVAKGALALGATALGGYALSRALPRGTQALQGQLLPALPQGPQQIGAQARPQLPAPGQATIQPPPPQAPRGPLPYTNPTAQNAPIRPGPQQVPQPPSMPPLASAPSQSPAGMTPSVQAPSTTPLPPALHAQVSNLLKGGNSIDKIEGAIKSLQPEIVKDYEKATNQSIRSAIEEFAKKPDLSMQQPSSPSGIREKTQEATNAMEQPSSDQIFRPITQTTEGGKKSLIEEGLKKYNEHMSKGSTVALPSGEIGEISDIRQGIARIQTELGEYSRKLDELIQSPVSKEQLHELWDKLVKGIEQETGQEVSRAINYVGFNPEEKSLVVNYTGAGKDSFVFEDLDEARVNRLLALEQMRRTSGNNLVGGWEEGTKSVLGSAVHDLVKELEAERGGKGTAHAFKYRTLYDAIEPAKKAKEDYLKKVSAEKKEAKAKEKENAEEKHSLEALKEKLKKEKKKALDKEYEKAINSHVEKLISDMKSDIKEREKKIKEDSNPQTKSLRESTLKSKKEKLAFYEEYYPKHGYKGVLTPKEYNEIKKKVKFLHG